MGTNAVRPSKERRRALGLELETCVGVRHTLFPFGSERAFVVGSSPHADVRLAFAELAPVEFHIERCHDELRLFPASSLQRIRVNGRPVVGSARLAAACSIEFSGQYVFARTFDATGHEACEPPPHEPSGVAYLAALPAENATTRLALPVVPRSLRDSDAAAHDVPTIVLRRPPGANAPVQWGPHGTEVLRREQLAQLAEALPPPRAAAVPASLRSATTQIDVPLAAFQATKIVPVRKPPSWKTRWTTRVRKRPGPLALSGVLAACALVTGLTLSHFSRGASGSAAVVPSSGAAPTRPAGRVAAASATTLASLPPPSPVTPAVTVVMKANAAVPGSGQHDPGAPLDTEVSDAIQHLVAGRDIQAKLAYERLGTRSPENPAFSTLTRLLERLASPPCATTPAPASCPVVKR